MAAAATGKEDIRARMADRLRWLAAIQESLSTMRDGLLRCPQAVGPAERKRFIDMLRKEEELRKEIEAPSEEAKGLEQVDEVLQFHWVQCRDVVLVRVLQTGGAFHRDAWLTRRELKRLRPFALESFLQLERLLMLYYEDLDAPDFPLYADAESSPPDPHAPPRVDQTRWQRRMTVESIYRNTANAHTYARWNALLTHRVMDPPREWSELASVLWLDLQVWDFVVRVNERFNERT